MRAKDGGREREREEGSRSTTKCVKESKSGDGEKARQRWRIIMRRIKGKMGGTKSKQCRECEIRVSS